MRKNVIGLLLLLTAGVLFGQQTRVAVQTFANGRGISTESAKNVTNLVIGRLVGIVEVYDRDSFDKIVAEHKFQASDWASKEQMAKLGAAVGVSYIIRGDMDTEDGIILVTARMIDINTAQVVASGDTEFARLNEARNKLPELTDGIVTTLSRTQNTTAKQNTQKPTAQQNAQKPTAKSGIYKIGDRGPGGGIVFYAEGDARLECSDRDLDKLSWANAEKIVAECRDGGCNDWRLPTLEELWLMHRNLKLNNLGDFSDDYYWSSKTVLGRAVGVNFGKEKSSPLNQKSVLKTNSYYVRAVRSF